MRRILLLFLLVNACRPASAAIIVPLAEPELVGRSDTIAFGTVVRTRTVRGRTGMIKTQADVQVYRGVRGAKAGDVIVIEVPGGDLGNGVVAEVPGSPRLAVGDMVFGFLETRDGARRPLGMSFGLLAVEQVGPGDLRVFRNLVNLQLAPRGSSPADPEAYVIAGEPFADFLGRIEGEAKRLAPSAPAPRRVQP